MCTRLLSFSPAGSERAVISISRWGSGDFQNGGSTRAHSEKEKDDSKESVLSVTPGPVNKLRSLPRKSKITRMPLLWPKVTTDATGRMNTLNQSRVASTDLSHGGGMPARGRRSCESAQGSCFSKEVPGVSSGAKSPATQV